LFIKIISKLIKIINLLELINKLFLFTMPYIPLLTNKLIKQITTNYPKDNKEKGDKLLYIFYNNSPN